MYTRFIYDKYGGAFWTRKNRFHQAEELSSPDLRKGDHTFVFVCVSINKGNVIFYQEGGLWKFFKFCKFLLIPLLYE